jgi:hypothetical protein
MTARDKPIGRRPRGAAERWIGAGKETPPEPAKAEIYTARLTVDITPALRGRIKLIAFDRGITVAEMLRALFEERYGAGKVP